MKTDEASQAIQDLSKKKVKLKRVLASLDKHLPGLAKDLLGSEDEQETFEMLKNSIHQLFANSMASLDSQLLYYKCHMMKLKTNVDKQKLEDLVIIDDEDESSAPARLSLISPK